MKLFLKLLSLFAAFTALGQVLPGIEKQLKDYLETHPQADYNVDGILTKQEASKHRKMQDFISKQEPRLAMMPERTLAEHTYGPHWRNTLDFWKAESDGPTPVVLFFHPGGFVGGDKSLYYGDPLVMACLENGISVVTANYRYATQAPFPASHHDAARVVQYVRYHAKSWGIDPERVAMTGASAGGNMSVWLAVHEDLADPDNVDPVARQSTRLTTIIGVNSQTSNDPFFIWDKVYQGNDAHSSTYYFYGIKMMPVNQLKERLVKPRYRRMIYEASSLNHISKDDPPVFLIHPESLEEWNGKPLPPETEQSKYAHHIAFGKYFKDEYYSIGIPCELRGKNETTVVEQINWLRKWFEME
ncbi:MAG: alpha/beta hydrolase [Opitutaceae bacterium]|nr:alpha/beta hydrolase [Opitutaceae bacterium]